MRVLICHLYGGKLAEWKRRPTYDLEAVKLAIGAVETLALTTSALKDATALGFNRGGIVYVKFQADVVTEFTLMSFKEK